MKKIYLFLMLFAATALNAQVAFLKVSDTYPDDYGDEQPEQQAYNWFVDTYGPGNVVNSIPANASTYKVLWVNVERDISEADFDDLLFPEDKRNALRDYVKAGGNLLLTQKACRLACHIGRMGDRGGSKYYPTWNNSEYGVGGDIWTINAMIGVGCTLRDARQHPIFKDMTKGTYNDYAHESFPLIGKVNRSDNNCIWTEMETEAGGNTPNDKISTLNNFQSDWNCQVLAVWGHVRDYCGPVIVEFFPQGEDYKGSVITIGASAYQWGKSNDYISNVKTLTSNALNYLSQGGSMYGYYMPYTLSEIYSREAKRPDFEAAKWFYDNYVTAGTGRFIYKDQTIPDEMKVLWVNNDHINQAQNAFYSDMGGEDFVSKLNAFVRRGGNIYLSKQACYLAYKMGKIYNPSWENGGYKAANNDAWPINAKAIGRSVEGAVVRDTTNHPIYRYMTASPANTITKENGVADIPYETFMLVDKVERTDNNYIWTEMDYDSIGNHRVNTDPEKLSEFETKWNCKVLAVWGHVENYCGAGLIEFLPAESGQGRIIANGFAAYQWINTNGQLSNVQDLTKGVLRYFITADPRVPGCDNCFYYISE